MTSRSEQTFDTTDLTLATVLVMHGGKGKLGRKPTKGDPVALWSFESTDQLEKVVLDYQQEKVRVEPRAFYKKMSQVRTEMFSFLKREKDKDEKEK